MWGGTVPQWWAVRGVVTAGLWKDGPGGLTPVPSVGERGWVLILGVFLVPTYPWGHHMGAIRPGGVSIFPEVSASLPS